VDFLKVFGKKVKTCVLKTHFTALVKHPKMGSFEVSRASILEYVLTLRHVAKFGALRVMMFKKKRKKEYC